jgi:methyltransferase
VARDARERLPDGKEQEDVVISLDWLRGRDRKVVDGLWAFLIRKVGDAVRIA